MNPIEQADKRCSDDVVAEALKLPPHPLTTKDLLAFGHAVWHRSRAYSIREGANVALAAMRGETTDV